MFSCAMGSEEHCKQISLVCVGSARSVWTTLGLPQLTAACAFPAYIAQVPGCSARKLSKADLCFVHLPGLSCSGSGSWVLHKDTDSGMHCVLFPGLSSSGNEVLGEHTAHCPRWSVHLNYLPGPSHSVSQCATRAPYQVCFVSPLGS